METAVIQITTQCPYQCEQCYMKRGTEHMPLHKAEDIVSIAKENGARAIQITGGEPMVYPWICEFIEYCSNKNLYTMLATSGYNHSKELYRRLQASGLTAICVSINSIDENINIYSRQGYTKAVQAIQDAVTIDLPSFANVVLNQTNLCNLERTVVSLQEMGVCGVQILKRFSSYRGEIISPLNVEQLTELYRIATKYSDFVQVENCMRDYWHRFYSQDLKCSDRGILSAFWSVDGNISPCSQKTECKYSSIHEMLAAMKQWEGDCR